MGIEQSPCVRCKFLRGELIEVPGIDDDYPVVDINYFCKGDSIEPKTPREECMGFSLRKLRPDGRVTFTPVVDRRLDCSSPSRWQRFLSAIIPFYCRSEF